MSSSSANYTQAADSEAIALEAAAGNTVARDQAVSVSSGGKNIGESAVDQSSGQGTVATDGALSQGGYASRNLAANAVDLNSSNNNTITYGTTAEDVNKLAQNFTSALNAQASAGSSTLDTVLNNLTPLAESKQTEGLSSLATTALWALGIIATALLIWKWNK